MKSYNIKKHDLEDWIKLKHDVDQVLLLTRNNILTNSEAFKALNLLYRDHWVEEKEIN